MNPPETALSGLSVAVVGAGAVGHSLAAWTGAAGGCVSIVAGPTGSERCRDLAERVGARAVDVGNLDSSGLDLLLLAAPSPALGPLAASLSKRPQARIALHVAGDRGAEVLAPLARCGVGCGSLHPLRAFPRPLSDLAVAAATVFAIDGCDEALATARRLTRAWGAASVVVPGEQRALYHLAATLCAGGAVALLAAAAAIARHLELGEAVVSGYRRLAIAALEEAVGPRPEEKLTGPAARGDTRLLEQLEELRSTLPELHPVAVTTALEVLRQVISGGRCEARHEHLAKALAELARHPGFLDPLLRPMVSS